ncbi:MAG TPA: VOC family protein [Candidatus Limnocylindrales bacterium]|nr:VOC family protein [Candidatus Limnocylindrales bacterium]
MTHYSRLEKIVIDVPPAVHDAEVVFWAAATGKQLTQFEKYPEYHGADLNEHMGLLIQRLEEGESRIHLDIHTDDLEAEIKRLESLGAQRVAQHHLWQVMRDPAGMVFCVIPHRRGTLDDSNATRWD